MSEYKKTVASYRLDGTMSATEGKQPLSFAGYKMLVMTFLRLSPQASSGGNHRGDDGSATTWLQGIFGWAFLVLQWNLIARSVTIGAIMLSHIAWRDDHLTLTMPKSKSDRTGESVFPRTVYANVLEPSVCPILALAAVILCRPYRPDGERPQLFDGPDQEERYAVVGTCFPF